MQSINKKKLNVLRLFDKESTIVKASDISESFAKAPPSHSVAAHNLHNNNSFIGTKIIENTSKTARSKNDEERKGVFQIICELPQYQGSLEVEIDKYSGNPLEYQYFASVLNQVVEKKVNGQPGRLARLLSVTGVESKELIKHCINLQPGTGYETAGRLLKSSHKNPHYLLPSYRKKIKALPSVKPGDASGFRKSYSFVLKCKTFSKSTGWNALETPETFFILVSKLPGSLRDRWNRNVQVVRKIIGGEPCLSGFVNFEHEETNLVNDPIFLKDAVLEYLQAFERKHDKKRNMEVFAAKGREVVKCSLCEIMTLMIVTHFYSLIYRKGVSGCFITKCVRLF